jgi:hypothetical protein
MGFFLAAAAFASALFYGRRSLGAGMVAVLTCGFAYGILRARFLDTFAYFIFDAAVLGLYLARLTLPGALWPPRARGLAQWTACLIGWPVVMFALCLIWPQHPLIQLVGLRAAVWFLPFLLLGASARAADLTMISRALAALNLIALTFGVGEYLVGLEAFFPRNAVTELMYISSDVGSRGAYRIPATFNQAAGYGGVMVLTVPLLLGRWSGQGAGFAERLLLAAGLGAAVLGVFLCGSRAPVLVLFLLAGYFALTLRARFRAVILVGLLVVVAVYVVSGNERLQRFTTLEDPELIVSRVGGSVNVGVVDLLLEYPMGSGLGSAVGTSIPAFLKNLAQEQIGAENEYVRIGLEQGLTGVVLWAAFLVWLFTRPPASWDGEWGMGLRLARVYVFLAWGAAALSTGFLTAIPATALVLFLMGVLGREQFPARAPDVRVGSVRFHGASRVATAAPRAAH